MYLAPHCARPTPCPNPRPSSTTTGVPVWARAVSGATTSAARKTKRTKTPLRTVLIEPDSQGGGLWPVRVIFAPLRTISCTARAVARFFFNDTATTEIYTLSLHDALLL